MYCVKLYYVDFTSIDIRKFDYIITHTQSEVHNYTNTVINKNIIDIENEAEHVYNLQEEKDALDVDDYESDDDIDGFSEAFDNDN